MIRDPSDGSVRESSKPNSVSGLTNSVSGLPDSSTKPENIARLEKSRAWLAQYRKAVDDANRMNDKGEIPRSPEQGEG